VAECLGPCDRADVVVVSPSAAGRAAGGRPVWLGHVLDEAAIDDIVSWADAGGPGVAEAPEILSLYRFAPFRRTRSR
jgi:hypothetical protein